MRRIAAIKMLLHDRATTAGSILGVIAIVFLVGQQLAIFFGLLQFMSILADTSDADMWILTKSANNIDASGTLPLRFADRAAGMDGVRWAEPMIIGSGLLKRPDGNFQPVQVVGFERPRFAGARIRFQEGDLSALLDHEAITVDLLDLKTLGNPAVGDRFEINGRRVRVRALTKDMRGFGGIIVFTNSSNAREIVGFDPERCSVVLVKTAPGADAGALRAHIEAVLPNTRVVSTRDLSRIAKLYYLTNTGIGASFGFSTAIGALVGVVIIALTMYTNVLNKEKDYAVLRALGARKRDILVIVFYQAAFIALIGILVGFLFLALFVMGTRDSTLPVYLPIWVPPAHIAFTLVLCLIGSLLAMRKATSVEPASAFR